jgi:hypothetical protein
MKKCYEIHFNAIFHAYLSFISSAYISIFNLQCIYKVWPPNSFAYLHLDTFYLEKAPTKAVGNILQSYAYVAKSLNPVHNIHFSSPGHIYLQGISISRAYLSPGHIYLQGISISRAPSI